MHVCAINKINVKITSDYSRCVCTWYIVGHVLCMTMYGYRTCMAVGKVLPVLSYSGVSLSLSKHKHESLYKRVYTHTAVQRN
jgi:hypothetical protein